MKYYNIQVQITDLVCADSEEGALEKFWEESFNKGLDMILDENTTCEEIKGKNEDEAYKNWKKKVNLN